MPSLSAWVSKIAPPQHHGAALGYFRARGSLARAIGPALGGVGVFCPWRGGNIFLGSDRHVGATVINRDYPVAGSAATGGGAEDIMKAGGTSWLPLVGAFALIGIMFALTVGEDPDRGKFGPKLRYGLPNPKELYFPGLPADKISVTVDIDQVSDNFLAPFATADYRAGLELIGWNAVAVRPIDDAYTTRLMTYGVMDHLSGMVAANGGESPVPARVGDEWRLVATYPRGEEPLPLPVTRVLMLSTNPSSRAMSQRSRLQLWCVSQLSMLKHQHTLPVAVCCPRPALPKPNCVCG